MFRKLVVFAASAVEVVAVLHLMLLVERCDQRCDFIIGGFLALFAIFGGLAMELVVVALEAQSTGA